MKKEKFDKNILIKNKRATFDYELLDTFTAGIGENGSLVRKLVVERLKYLGITLNEEANNRRGDITEISTKDSNVRVFVIPTNEEYMIAKDTMQIVFGK